MTAERPGNRFFDLCVIGGGINGAGIARDAAGRGLSVALIEKDDLACATSSASTKLIHGGLRYLEYGQMGLVRHALQERETLLNMAPHIIAPMEFVLPHDSSVRPAWMIGLGLFLYDRLARRDKLPPSRRRSLAGGPLDERYETGFSYSDCRVDDSRLVVLNALSAAENGATVLTRTRCTGLEADHDANRWIVHRDGGPSLSANMVVNAAGPWVRSLLDDSRLADDSLPRVRLVRGSHIIVPRQYDGEHAYILQQPDKRIVFVIPYERDFTLIGTTETAFDGDPATVMADAGEIAYLCEAFNHSFRKKITAADVLWTYSGVRPLLDESGRNDTSLSRGYKLVVDNSHGPPLLSVFGGKITTYRYLAEEAVTHLTGTRGWTGDKSLPGGNIPDFSRFLKDCTARYSSRPADLVARCARAYGTRIDMFFGKEPGRHFGGGLYESEVRYLVDHEWAKTAEDILWRRTKLGLHVPDDTAAALDQFLAGISAAPSRQTA